MRIALALERAGLKTWWYEVHSKPGKVFTKLYDEKVRECTDFIFIDTPSARASKDVQEECRIALERLRHESSDFSIHVCLLKDRIKELNFPVFELINQITYIDFRRIDFYDGGQIYHQAINELCQSLNAEYLLWSHAHRTEDFQKELFEGHVSVSSRDLLLKEFELFTRWNHIDQKVAYEKICSLNQMMQVQGLQDSLLSPQLAKGCLELDLFRVSEALDTFQGAISQFPKDPRIMEGLAHAYFYSREYDLCRSELLKAKKLISSQYQHNPNFQKSLKTIEYNLLKVLIISKDHAEYERTRQSISPDYLNTIEFQILQALYYAKSRKGKELFSAYPQIQTLSQTNQQLNTQELNFLLAELESSIAAFLLQKRSFFKTLKTTLRVESHLKKAFDLESSNIRYGAELANFYHAMRSYYNEQLILDKVLSLTPVTFTDHYFLGLAHYLSGAHTEANRFLKLSKKNNWPDYQSLTNYG